MDSVCCPVLLAALAVSLCSSPALADRKFGKNISHFWFLSPLLPINNNKKHPLLLQVLFPPCVVPNPLVSFGPLRKSYSIHTYFIYHLSKCMSPKKTCVCVGVAFVFLFCFLQWDLKIQHRKKKSYIMCQAWWMKCFLWRIITYIVNSYSAGLIIIIIIMMMMHCGPLFADTRTQTTIMHWISYGCPYKNYSTHAPKEHAILNPVKYLIISYASSSFIQACFICQTWPACIFITLDLFFQACLTVI